jgi:pyruvate kinase
MVGQVLPSVDPSPYAHPEQLLSTLRALRQTVEAEGLALFDEWRPDIERPDFLPSALNLAHYLALRRHDLRPLQMALTPWGLSSLGRIEARVMPNLDAVIATLSRIVDRTPTVDHPPLEAFFEGECLLRQHTADLFGAPLPHRRVRIMVTLPTQAATDYDFVRAILVRGASCVRINCAHDDAAAWAAMIAHTRRAEAETGKACKVMMDLGGPKIRTGPVLVPAGHKRLHRGDTLVLARTVATPETAVMGKPGTAAPTNLFQTSCTVPEILEQLAVGTPIYIDDGKLRTRVVDTQYPLPDGQTGLLLEVTHARPKGEKLKPEKGLNFPGTVLPLNPLTAKDREDLDFVAGHADIIGYSFVQQASDIAQLQAELEPRCQGRSERPAIVAKIETPIAISNLPELIVHAAGKQSFGVMIARGDLAVEIGYQRLAEMQEEILWLCEAAHVPVIWATQGLENLVKNGAPSRGEMTDAAMAERAECVMLNKGPFIAEAITILDDVLTRMEAHQLKKTPQLRALHSW